ncbi:hypothetical protein OH738_31880 [Streptomyces hirsutus]|nr:hypothetical protein OH738_31880 [Streptomyces hirsutus]
MRRVTVQKPLKRTTVPRGRGEPEDRPAPRPEIREDIARTWWPTP